MLKLIYFILWFLIIFKFLILQCESFTCVHDQIIQQEPALLKRDVKFEDYREQRARDPKLFEPLNIYFYLDNFDASVSSNVIHNVELALRKVRKYISETFQVYKRKNPFVLERKACSRRWQAGPNKGKCSRIVNEQEVCESLEITYPIPDRFLDKLELYDYEREKPRYELPPGSGLLTSNFITFITSESSSICEGTDVSAFGTYCRLDRETNEPLAGILNLCPTYFEGKIYPSDHYYNVILHEMFHILGFSINLFEKFLPCQKGAHCGVPKNVIQTDAHEVPRLMFPLVIKHMQEHFSCSVSDFGGPMVLEVINSTEDEETKLEHYSSHWDPVLMYSSVMMPKFSEFDNVLVDNITLSVFGSTGWYHMNYSQAEAFRFGKDQGCDFGVNSTCDGNEFLCDPNSEHNLGCDLSHKSIGKCTQLSPQRDCGVYQPVHEKSCELKMGKQYGLDFYALGYQHKCFMIFKENDNNTATCLPLKCKSNSSYTILINMTWYDCPPYEMLNVKKISVQCPETSLFCTEDMVRRSTFRQFCPIGDRFFIAVRMYFNRPLFTDLYNSQGFKNFKVSTLKKIADEVNMPVNYIVNSSLSVFKKTQLDFIICPAPFKGAKYLTDLILKVQNFLDTGNFINTLSNGMIVSSLNVKVQPLNVISFSDHEGFQSLLAFPAICAIFLIATLVASIVRFTISRKR